MSTTSWSVHNSFSWFKWGVVLPSVKLSEPTGKTWKLEDISRKRQKQALLLLPQRSSVVSNLESWLCHKHIYLSIFRLLRLFSLVQTRETFTVSFCEQCYVTGSKRGVLRTFFFNTFPLSSMSHSVNVAFYPSRHFQKKCISGEMISECLLQQIYIFLRWTTSTGQHWFVPVEKNLITVIKSKLFRKSKHFLFTWKCPNRHAQRRTKFACTRSRADDTCLADDKMNCQILQRMQFKLHWKRNRQLLYCEIIGYYDNSFVYWRRINNFLWKPTLIKLGLAREHG